MIVLVLGIGEEVSARAKVGSIRRVKECLRRAKLRLRLAPTYFFKP
jgi:hypothetical protein